MTPYKIVSFQDLRHIGFDLDYKAVEKDDGTIIAKEVKLRKHSRVLSEREVLTVLWHLGCDIVSSNYAVSKKRKHRCISRKEIIFDHMFMCLERTDKKWIKKGMPSPEAFAASSNMRDMEKALKSEFIYE